MLGAVPLLHSVWWGKWAMGFCIQSISIWHVRSCYKRECALIAPTFHTPFWTSCKCKSHCEPIPNVINYSSVPTYSDTFMFTLNGLAGTSWADVSSGWHICPISSASVVASALPLLKVLVIQLCSCPSGTLIAERKKRSSTMLTLYTMYLPAPSVISPWTWTYT